MLPSVLRGHVHENAMIYSKYVVMDRIKYRQVSAAKVFTILSALA